MPSITILATESTLNVKVDRIKGKIPNITNLATKTALNNTENKILSVRNLVKKTHYDTKINELKIKLLIIMMINVLLIQNLIRYHQKMLLQN